MKNRSDLAIVAPFYNEEDALPGTLEALYRQDDHNAEVILVDNGSTDGSRGVIDAFSREYPDFPVRIIEESQKGTGAAADTGMREAIKRGHRLIARTDVDTQPRSDWTRVIQTRMDGQSDIQLLGGTSKALHDKFYKPSDDIIAPALLGIGRVALAIKTGSRLPLRIALGHNLATRADAYEQTGGFPRGSIAEVDEDKVYAKAIFDHYGYDALALDKDLVVYTSARRIRKVGGYAHMFAYYFDVNPEYRLEKTGGDVDVR